METERYRKRGKNASRFLPWKTNLLCVLSSPTLFEMQDIMLSRPPRPPRQWLYFHRTGFSLSFPTCLCREALAA